tara:strand:+ start:175 stop:435 length:261 start_codon:yes stop_codon:yes gene_type:complete
MSKSLTRFNYVDEPIRALEENTLESLQAACKTNKENRFNSLDIVYPIAKQMLSHMHSNDLLEFIENRYQVLQSRMNEKCFNVEVKE